MPLGTRDILVLIRAQDLASRELSRVGGGFGKMAKQARDANQSIATANEKHSKSLQDLSRRSKDVRSEYTRTVANGIKPFNDAMRANNTTIAKNATQTSKMRAALSGMSAEQKVSAQQAIKNTTAQNAALREVNLGHRSSIAAVREKARVLKTDELGTIERIKRAELDRHNTSMRIHRTELGNIADTQRAMQRATTVGRNMMSAGAVMAVAGGVGVAAFGLMAKSAMEFRQEAAMTLTQVDGLNVGIGRLETMAQDAGKAIPVSIGDLQEGLYDIFSSIDVSGLEQADDLLRKMSKAAVAGNTDLRTTTRATISMLNAFDDGKITVEGMEKALDVQFQTVRKGVLTYEELNESIGRAIPAARQSGQSLETLGGAMAFITRRGLDAEMAATSVARAFELLGHSKVRTRMAELGISITDTTGEYRQFDEIIQELSAHLGDMTGPEQAKALEDLFKGAGNRIQARRFLISAIQNAGEFSRRVGEMHDAAGTMEDAYDIMFNQPLSQMRLFGNNLQILGQEIGMELFPAVNSLLETGKGMLEWFQSLSPEARKLIVWTGAISSALVALAGVAVAASGAMVILRTNLMAMTGASTISSGIGALAGKLSMLVAAAGPVGVAIAGIALVGTGLAMLRMKDDTISASEGLERLAQTSGLAYNELSLLGQAADSALSDDFMKNNEALINSLRGMSNAAGQASLIQIGVEAIARGNSIEDARTTMQALADAAGIEFSVELEEFNLLAGSSDLIQSAATLGTELADTVGNYFGDVLGNKQGKLREQIASSINVSLQAGDIEGAIKQWSAFETSMRSSGLTAGQQKIQINGVTEAVLSMSNAQGLNLMAADNMAGGLAQLASESSSVSDETKEYLNLINETRDSLGRINWEAVAANVEGIEDPTRKAALSLQSYNAEVTRFTTLSDAAIAGLEGVEGAFSDIEQPEVPAYFDQLAQAVQRFVDPQSAYQEVLKRGEESIRAQGKASEWTSEQIDEHLSTATVSMQDFLGELESQYTEMENFKTNLVTIARTVGPEFALAMQDWDASVVAEFANDATNGVTENFERLIPIVPSILSEAGGAGGLAFATDILGQIEGLPEDIASYGDIAAARMSQQLLAGAENGFTTWTTQLDEYGQAIEDSINDHAENLNRNMPSQFTRIGDSAGLNLGVALKEGVSSSWPAFEQSMAAYSASVLRTVNPILGSLNKPQIAHVTGGPGGVTEFNVGGQVPGGYGAKDDVLAMLTRGEYVIRNSAVRKYGPAAMEAVNDGSAKIIKRNIGGAVNDMVMPTNVPKMPTPPTSFPSVGTYLQDMGEGGQEWLYKGVEEWVKENLAPTLGPGIGWQAMWAALQAGQRSGQIPPVALFSAFRPGAITATGNPSYHGMGRAVDITPSMAIFDWLVSNYGRSSREIIFSPANGRQMRNGGQHMYSEPTRGNHWDHIHWAMANGGIVNSPVSALIGERGPEAVMPLDTFVQAVSQLRLISTVNNRIADELAAIEKQTAREVAAIEEGLERNLKAIEELYENQLKPIEEAFDNTVKAIEKAYDKNIDSKMDKEVAEEIRDSAKESAQEAKDIAIEGIAETRDASNKVVNEVASADTNNVQEQSKTRAEIATRNNPLQTADSILDAFDAIQNVEDANQSLRDARQGLRDVYTEVAENEKALKDIGSQISHNVRMLGDIPGHIRRTNIEILAAQRDARKVTNEEFLSIESARDNFTGAMQNYTQLRSNKRTPEQELGIMDASQNRKDAFAALKDVAVFRNGAWRAKLSFDTGAIDIAQNAKKEAIAAVFEAKREVAEAARSLGSAKATLQEAKATHVDAMAAVSQKRTELKLADFEIARSMRQAALVKPHDEVKALLYQYQALKQKADANKAVAEAQKNAATTAKGLREAQDGMAQAQLSVNDARKSHIETIIAQNVAQTELNRSNNGTKATLNEVRRLVLGTKIAQQSYIQTIQNTIVSTRQLDIAHKQAIVARQALTQANRQARSADDKVNRLIEIRNGWIERGQELAENGKVLREEEVAATAAVVESKNKIAASQRNIVNAEVSAIRAQMALIRTTEELIDINPEFIHIFRKIANSANVSTGSINHMVNAMVKLRTTTNNTMPSTPNVVTGPTQNHFIQSRSGSSGGITIQGGLNLTFGGTPDRNEVKQGVTDAFRTILDDWNQ